ncbi:hypothetical protein KEJ47_10165, partial [Candidatus Bathyarchaeota archaeon]|nr:hypothetical protein [Candidatus Bathyarchaeota archaeon]
GYAVSSLARHRFSVDLDIVIQRKELRRFGEVLKKNGFEKQIEKAGFDEVYGGEFISYLKRVDNLQISVDLLVDSLVCRATNASWSFDYIRKHSVVADIAGMEMVVKCRVPEKELLIASKIHSGRRADIRDVVVLMERADLGKVTDHLKRGDLKRLRGQIDGIAKALRDERLMDSLKGVFAISTNVSEQIENARRNIEEVVEKIFKRT